MEGGVSEVEKGLQGVQKEIEMVVDAVKQLNKQRNEAQKRLLELDENVGSVVLRDRVVRLNKFWLIKM